ncbi:hypothetical protein ABIE48_002682 [Paenibacillus sp. OAE614]
MNKTIQHRFPPIIPHCSQPYLHLKNKLKQQKEKPDRASGFCLMTYTLEKIHSPCRNGLQYSAHKRGILSRIQSWTVSFGI